MSPGNEFRRQRMTEYPCLFKASTASDTAVDLWYTTNLSHDARIQIERADAAFNRIKRLHQASALSTLACFATFRR